MYLGQMHSGMDAVAYFQKVCRHLRVFCVGADPSSYASCIGAGIIRGGAAAFEGRGGVAGAALSDGQRLVLCSGAIHDRSLVCPWACAAAGTVGGILTRGSVGAVSDEVDADARCGEAVRQAVQCDPASHEAWQTMASYCISAQRADEGKEALLKSVSLWINAQQDGR